DRLLVIEARVRRAVGHREKHLQRRRCRHPSLLLATEEALQVPVAHAVGGPPPPRAPPPSCRRRASSDRRAPAARGPSGPGGGQRGCPLPPEGPTRRRASPCARARARSRRPP